LPAASVHIMPRGGCFGAGFEQATILRTGPDGLTRVIVRSSWSERESILVMASEAEDIVLQRWSAFHEKALGFLPWWCSTRTSIDAFLTHRKTTPCHKSFTATEQIVHAMERVFIGVADFLSAIRAYDLREGAVVRPDGLGGGKPGQGDPPNREDLVEHP
jgi:hypothetical protein